jgi:hypothetical protein
MRVVSFINKVERRAYRSRRSVRVGEECYAIQDNDTGLYFAWSYTSERYANHVAGSLIITNQADRDFNWKRDINHTVISSRDF